MVRENPDPPMTVIARVARGAVECDAEVSSTQDKS